MPYRECELPEYPCKEDMWDKLVKEKRPIVIYGMGNGADKLINRFQRLGIVYSDIFASDGFVRGHSFRGIRVKSLSEIKERYPEFVIVLSFASNRAEVVDMLEALDGQYDVYVPDMPVAGEDEYFDRAFFNEHYSEIKEAYMLLKDESSKNAFASVVRYKLSGRMKYLTAAFSSKEEMYALINSNGKIKSVADCGAYNGDTLREFFEYFKDLEYALAIEADTRNYNKLKSYAAGINGAYVETVNAALWSDTRQGSFISSGNRNSSVSASSSYKHKNEAVRLVTLDSICSKPLDYIKYDVEGAELEALIGSHRAIEESKPILLISVYHRSRDIYSLIDYVSKKHEGYEFYLRRLRCVPAWELNLIALPKKSNA